MDLSTEEFLVKIADLGLAKEVVSINDDFAETTCGSPLYMSPQVLQGGQYNYKADIWSIGALYFELLTGFCPFTGNNYTDLQNNQI